jgi:hypothetical protein
MAPPLLMSWAAVPDDLLAAGQANSPAASAVKRLTRLWWPPPAVCSRRDEVVTGVVRVEGDAEQTGLADGVGGKRRVAEEIACAVPLCQTSIVLACSAMNSLPSGDSMVVGCQPARHDRFGETGRQTGGDEAIFEMI